MVALRPALFPGQDNVLPRKNRLAHQDLRGHQLINEEKEDTS